AVSVWAGGLLVLFLLGGRMDETQAVTAVRRFSPWALASVIALALSGLISAWIRLSGWSDLLTTGYGRVVLAKALGLTVLAVIGALQRRRLGDRIRFRHLAVSEGLVMAVVIGASIALGRSAPPVPQDIPAVGELRTLSLVGYLPPERGFSPRRPGQVPCRRPHEPAPGDDAHRAAPVGAPRPGHAPAPCRRAPQRRCAARARTGVGRAALRVLAAGRLPAGCRADLRGLADHL